MWLLKPTGFNRGKGIHVVSSFKKLKKLVREYCSGKIVEAANDNQEVQEKTFIRCATFVIQKYIERPLLINNRKFDIRVWILLT